MSTATVTAPRVLVVGASPREEGSYALALADAVVEAFVAEHPGAEVDRLDAFSLAPFGARRTAAKMAVIAGEDVPEAAAAEWEDVRAVFERVAAADLLVFAVPLWNHGLPWALKLFIDTITQPGLAFSFDPETGYTGLLVGRRAVAVYTSAVYSPGVAPAFGTDEASPYLRSWLAFVGIDDVREVRLQPTYPTPDFEERRQRAHDEAGALGATLAEHAALR
jgi:FMN-dependent NADH-azoreductase